MRVSRARYLCFPADATVELASGATKPLEQLQLGERVRVDARGGGGGADSADADFAPVYFFGHADPHATATFVALRLAGGAVLTLSPTHYVPVGAARREVYAIDVVLLRSSSLDPLLSPAFQAPALPSPPNKEERKIKQQQ